MAVYYISMSLNYQGKLSLIILAWIFSLLLLEYKLDPETISSASWRIKQESLSRKRSV